MTEFNQQETLDIPLATTDPEVKESSFDPHLVIDLMDSIIVDLYHPFRGQEGYGTERAILVEEKHVPHRENDAEHSWHLTLTCLLLYKNRKQLGIYFPPNFDEGNMLTLCNIHDIAEIESPDVDSMSTDENLIMNKARLERQGAQRLFERLPYLAKISLNWEEYEAKESYEAQIVSDVDKLIGLRLIYLDNGKRWQTRGQAVTMRRMLNTIRAKLLTEIGIETFRAIEEDIVKLPHLFAEKEYPQDSLFPN